jgi:hypothetical protein
MVLYLLFVGYFSACEQKNNLQGVNISLGIQHIHRNIQARLALSALPDRSVFRRCAQAVNWRIRRSSSVVRPSSGWYNGRTSQTGGTAMPQ